jgi:HIV Tat-specific factor 1
MRALEQQVRLGWADEGDEAGAGAGGLCIVVLRNLFGAAEAAAPGFVAELCADVAPELEARCGALAKLTVFPRHAEGVAVAKFRTPGGAAACLTAMHGRFFGGRKLAVSYWDGSEDFTHKEGAQEAASREESFGAWLDAHGGAEEDAAKRA